MLILQATLMTNTPYCASHDIQITINTLQDSSAKLFDWFSNNSMKANANKFIFY